VLWRLFRPDEEEKEKESSESQKPTGGTAWSKKKGKNEGGVRRGGNSDSEGLGERSAHYYENEGRQWGGEEYRREDTEKKDTT